MLFCLAHSVTSTGKTTIGHTIGLGLVDYVLRVMSTVCEVPWAGVKERTNSASVGL